MIAVLRRLVFPSLVAGPVWLLSSELLIRRRLLLDWGFAEAAVAAFFSFVGLLIVGLPLAVWIGRLDFPLPVKIGALVVTGALSGFLLIAVFYYSLTLSLFGVVPGACTALIWVALNIDLLLASKRNSRA